MAVLFTFALAPVVRWRRLWFRTMRRSCPICGDKLQGQIGNLLGQGFYQAAVTASRLRLELLAVAYFQRVRDVATMPRDSRAKRERPSFRAVVLYLHEIGEVDNLQRNKLLSTYARTSHVVHGQPCPRHTAKRLVAEVQTAIDSLRGGAA